MSKLNCIIITPNKKVRNIECDYIGATGVEGDFGILPLHAPFISELAPGVLFLRNQGKKDDPIGIVSGFLHVFEDKVTVIADKVYEKSDIEKSTDEYKKQYEKKKQALEKLEKSDSQYANVKAETDKLLTLLNLAAYK